MTQEAPTQTVLACSQCGRMYTHSDLVQIAGNWVCGDCKPAFLSRVVTGGTGTDALTWHYGGFWIRFAARMIDGIILGIPFVIIMLLFFASIFRTVGTAGPGFTPWLMGSVFALAGLALVVSGVYEVLFLRYRGATPGKMAVGVKVVRSSGADLGWGVSVGRFFMWNVVTSATPYLNSILMLISGIMCAVDEEKRALHDRVCDTRVIYKGSMA